MNHFECPQPTWTWMDSRISDPTSFEPHPDYPDFHWILKDVESIEGVVTAKDHDIPGGGLAYVVTHERPAVSNSVEVPRGSPEDG